MLALDPGFIEVVPWVYQEYVVHLRPLYTQTDKYELLKKMTLEADEYKFNAEEVEMILKVWGEWIHEKPDTYSTLTNIRRRTGRTKRRRWKHCLESWRLSMCRGRSE